MAQLVKDILEEAESLKKRADIHFAKSQYNDAVVAYTLALKRLAFTAGMPIGEINVARCFSNQAQCYLKMSQFERALQSVNMGLTVPSVAHNSHMLSKLLIRKAMALQGLNDIESALSCVDKVISLGLPSHEEYDNLRGKIIQIILAQEGVIIPIPPKPVIITAEVVSGIITHMLVNKGDHVTLYPLLQDLIKQRCWIDREDDKQNNIMWAICQAAMIQAQKSSESTGDDVFPLLELIVTEGGSMAEQRFSNISNKTPLQVFSMAGAVKCVQLLIQNGASTHTLDDDGWSALIVACAPNGPCSGRNSSVVQMLVSGRSNINHATKSGLTALSAAAQSNDEESVKILLMNGASISKRCALGFSPIIWAKIGSDGDLNAAGRVILSKINNMEENRVKLELEQDIVCYGLAQLLVILEAYEDKLNHTEHSPSNDELNELIHGSRSDQFVETQRLLVQFMLEIFKIDTSSLIQAIDQDRQSFVTLPEAIHRHVHIMLTPSILTKKWLPKDENHDYYEVALNAANPVEISWIQIMTLSIRGSSTRENPSSNQTSNPPLETNENLPFFVLSMYRSYQRLIQYPISRQYTYTIPSYRLISHIIDSSSSVLLIFNDSFKVESNQYFSLLEADSNMRNKSIAIEITKISLWEDDTVDLGLMTYQSSTQAFTSSAHSTGLIIVEYLIDDMLLLKKSDEERMILFQSASELIRQQFEISSLSRLIIIGTISDDDAESLANGKAMLIHELTEIIVNCFNSSSLTQLMKIELPSWPFEKSFAIIIGRSSNSISDHETITISS